jgi:phage terminase large subunit
VRHIEVSANRAFVPAHESRHFWRVLKGAASSGKSYDLAQEYILHLTDKAYTGAGLLVVRKTEASHRSSTYAELTGAVYRIFGDLWPRIWEIRSSPLSLRCKITGAWILFRGCKDAQQLERLKSVTVPSGKLCWVWVEEATELSERDVDLIALRIRGTLPPALWPQVTLSFNPVSSAHWIKARFFDTPHPDVCLHESTWRDNRFNPPDYADRMAALEKANPELYRVYALGEWGEVGGLILTRWRVDDCPENDGCYDALSGGLDFGFNDPSALLSVGVKDQVVYIRREIYQPGLVNAELIELAEGVIPRTTMLWADCAEPDRVREWQRARYLCRGVVKRPHDDVAQIDWLKAHQIIVDPSCKHTIRELQLWKWIRDEQSGAYTDRPVDVLNHAMDALRYSVSEWVRYTPDPVTGIPADDGLSRQYLEY